MDETPEKRSTESILLYLIDWMLDNPTAHVWIIKKTVKRSFEIHIQAFTTLSSDFENYLRITHNNIKINLLKKILEVVTGTNSVEGLEVVKHTWSNAILFKVNDEEIWNKLIQDVFNGENKNEC